MSRGYTRRHLERAKNSRTGAIGPEHLSDTLRSGRYCFDDFMQAPTCHKVGSLVAPGGTDLQASVFDTGKHKFYYANIGDATDAFEPVIASEGGLNFVMTTATLDRGVEINFGGDVDKHPRNAQPSSEDFFWRMLFITDNASGIDLTFGVKKVASVVATLTEITDLYGIRVLGDSSSAAAAFSIITNLNNGGTSDYVTTAQTNTLADATLVELEVRTIGQKAYAFVDGVQVGSVDYTFDDDDYVAPIARLIQTTDLATQMKLLRFECGLYPEDRSSRLLSDFRGANT